MSETLCSDNPLTLNFTTDGSVLGATVSFFGLVCTLASAASFLLLADEKVMAIMLTIISRKMSFVLSKRNRENAVITDRN